MHFKNFVLPILAALLFASVSHADIVDPNRFVQIESVDFTTSVVQITNFDDTNTIDLDGWRFCTHDENEVRRYSGATGLNGFSLAPGESLFVHYDNDATAANEVNINDLGGFFAEDLDVGPDPGGAYSIGLYWRSNFGFGDGDSLADHIQWSYDGVDNDSADDRSDEAEGEVWLDQSDWISADSNTTRIDLNVANFDEEIHSSADYIVSVPEPASATLIGFGLAFAAMRRRRNS